MCSGSIARPVELMPVRMISTNRVPFTWAYPPPGRKSGPMSPSISTPWQAEHTRLFVNGFPSTPCPPFESAYRDGHLFGARVDELEDLYGRLGVESSGAPADFLGTLLECAAWLEAEPGARYALRHELWHGHLAHWLPRFCADLERHSRIHLYRVLASRLRALLPVPVTSDLGDS